MDYIDSVRAALRDNQHARAFYFPPNREERRRQNLRLAREVGYGLTPQFDIRGLYSTLIVSFSLDSTGVSIDAKEFFEEMRKVMQSV